MWLCQGFVKGEVMIMVKMEDADLVMVRWCNGQDDQDDYHNYGDNVFQILFSDFVRQRCNPHCADLFSPKKIEGLGLPPQFKNCTANWPQKNFIPSFGKAPVMMMFVAFGWSNFTALLKQLAFDISQYFFELWWLSGLTLSPTDDPISKFQSDPQLCCIRPAW